MREQTPESVEALRRLLGELVSRIIANTHPQRLLHAGQLVVFFDDTEIEVYGDHFEWAKTNYKGDKALSWQTLWVGPLLADCYLGSPGDVSSRLLEMLERNRRFWEGKDAHFYADSASSCGEYLEGIAAEGWHYTVSYNKWPEPLERLAEGLPQWAWKEKGGKYYSFIRHQPSGCKSPKLYAVKRWRDGLFYEYSFIACDDRQTDAVMVNERHALKGEKERLFSDLLSDLDLHRPPCLALIANQIYYLVGAMAYNLLVGVKLMYLGDEDQRVGLKKLLSILVHIPGKIYRRSRQWVVRLMVDSGWLSWWKRWLEVGWIEYGVGRPRLRVASG